MQRKPEFAQMSGGANGGLMQQDAEECLTEMLNCLNVVKTAGGKGIADENFGIEMQTETSLAEAEGGFGSRTSVNPEAVLVCWAAKRQPAIQLLVVNHQNLTSVHNKNSHGEINFFVDVRHSKITDFAPRESQ